jgi:hypothetical protein
VTRSFAVAIVAAFSVAVSFHVGGTHCLGAAISDGRAKNASSFANATRMTSSAHASIRSRPPATESVARPSSADEDGDGPGGLPHPAAATTAPKSRAQARGHQDDGSHHPAFIQRTVEVAKRARPRRDVSFRAVTSEPEPLHKQDLRALLPDELTAWVKAAGAARLSRRADLPLAARPASQPSTR